MAGGDDEDGDGSGPPATGATRASVRATYEEIGAHFAKTREYPWPEVESFLDGVDRRGTASPAVALDVGCGNGRHTALLAGVADRALGVDPSRTLLATARERADREGWRATATLCQGDAARLPVSDGAVDLALYVATVHHLPDRETRVASLDELARVLAPGGRALVSAWATVHDRFDADPDAPTGFDTTVDWTLPGGEVVPRFYHIYAPAEFEADLDASGLAVAETFVASGNCYARVSTEQ